MRKYRKAMRLMKDELGGEVMTKIVRIRPKTYPYLKDDDKEAKGTKNVL